jgi:hypothetical protein
MSGQQLLSWIDASNTEWPFNLETNYLAVEGLAGLTGMPPVALTESKTPLTDGATLRFALTDVRVVDVPLVVVAESYSQLFDACSALDVALNPKAGPGKLRITSPNGAVRDLNCIYAGGFEHDWSQGFSDHISSVLVFRAHDPYLYDTMATQVGPFLASAAPNFFPITPIKLGSSSVLSSFSIDNSGHVDAFPVWTIHGAGSAITLTNNTTGKSLALTGNGGLTLGSSDVLVIDTQARTVLLNGVTSQYNKLSFASSLWTLAKGFNSVSVSMTGTNGSSYIACSYKRRWLGA